MKEDKLDSLYKKIFSEKYSKEVQTSLEVFNSAVNNLVIHLGEIPLETAFDGLSETKRKYIYTYQCLILEKSIEDKKIAFEQEQYLLQAGVNLNRFIGNEKSRKIRLLRKRNMRFYTLQFLFSDPENYLSLKDDNIEDKEENNYMDYLIYNIDKIPNNLLINLGFLGDNYKKLLDERKLKTKKLDRLLIDLQLLDLKIKAIPLLKESVKGWKEIKKTEIKGTTRIMMIDSIDQNDGKIVLTQTPEMNKTIAVFDDIYSFFRSQSYSLNSIEEKQQVFTELKEKIEELLLGYTNRYGHDLEKLVREIVQIQAKMGPYNDYYSKKIKDKRFPKIKFVNSSSDSQVLIGIKNDLSEALNKSSSMKGYMQGQTEIIEEMIREHRNKIKHFNIAFREIINILDTDELLDLINDEEINKEFFDINKDVFSSIRKLIDDFLAPPRNTIAKPFKGFYHRLSGCKIKINDSIKKQDSIGVIRQLLILHLETKLKRFEGFKSQLENDYKLNNIVNNEENKGYILQVRYKLEEYRDYLKNKDFLEEVEVSGKTNIRFLKTIDEIGDMIVQIDKAEELFE